MRERQKEGAREREREREEGGGGKEGRRERGDAWGGGGDTGWQLETERARTSKSGYVLFSFFFLPLFFGAGERGGGHKRAPSR